MGSLEMNGRESMRRVMGGRGLWEEDRRVEDAGNSLEGGGGDREREAMLVKGRETVAAFSIFQKEGS